MYDLNLNTCNDYKNKNICQKQNNNYSNSINDSRNNYGSVN